MIRKISDYIVSHYVSRFWVLAVDVVASSLSTMFIYWGINFMTGNYVAFRVYLLIGLVALLTSLALSFIFKTHYGIIRHTSIREIWRILMLSCLKGLILFLVIYLSSINQYFGFMPLKVILIEIADIVFTLFLLLLIRVIVSNMYILMVNNIRVDDLRRVLIYGDDEESLSALGMIENSKTHHYKCIGFITFDHSITKKRLSGFPVFDVSNERLFQKVAVLSNIDSIIFPTMESARLEKDRIVAFCVSRKINVLVKPTLNTLDGASSISMPLREIKIEDLLGRDEVEINMEGIRSFLKGKVVLVTGAAGSIGGELCRQLSAVSLKKLILLDNAETPLHNKQLEFEEKYAHLSKAFVIADVRSRDKMESVFQQYRPDIVFHAAAYKHVPLMESFPCEAVGANVFGTMNVADLAVKYHVEKFIMISTDKAVNPANVMGASKRIAEIYVQTLKKHLKEIGAPSDTRFITTRFGNVLGSNGSVIPHFREQIASGGPVTVTHPDIVRYFMTIPEACKLVMEAATMGEGDEIFVFDMGKPVKILDLAKNMIKLAGLELDRDIQIKFMGLRPGEKLYEELLNNEENTVKTVHKKIFLAKVRKYNYEEVRPLFDELEKVSLQNDPEKTVLVMKKIVPEFISNNSQYEKLDK